MNKDIEKWEKENPAEHKELVKKNKNQKRVWYFVVIPLALLINSYFKGPPILYLLIGLIPWLLKKLDSQN